MIVIIFSARACLSVGWSCSIATQREQQGGSADGAVSGQIQTGRDVFCDVALCIFALCVVVWRHDADGLRAAAKPTSIIGVIGGDVAGHSGQAPG